MKLMIWYLRRIFGPMLTRSYQIVRSDRLRLGRNVFVDMHTEFCGHNFINDNARLISARLGKYSYVSPNTIIIDAEIGNYCSIGPNCIIGTGKHPLNELSTSPYVYNPRLFLGRNKEDFARVEIGHDVWIGANVTILGGLKIGDGAVIGANSLVTKDIEPYGIAFGSPARVKKYRLQLEKIERLSQLKWWELAPEEAKKVFDEFE